MESGKEGRCHKLSCLTFFVLLFVDFLDVALGKIPDQLLPYKARDDDHGAVSIWKEGGGEGWKGGETR